MQLPGSVLTNALVEICLLPVKINLPVPTDGSETFTFTYFMSHASTSPTFALDLFLDNKLFKQFINFYLKTQTLAWVEPEQDLEPCEQVFKTWFLDFYYSNLHIEYYQFGQ